MRTITFIVLPLSLLAGCHTQTDIERTIHRADGTVEVYRNYSDGYYYNPNFTGYRDEEIKVNDMNNTIISNVPFWQNNIGQRHDPFMAPISNGVQYNIR